MPSHPIALILSVFIFFEFKNSSKAFEIFSDDPENEVVCPVKLEPGSFNIVMCSSTITSLEYLLPYIT